MKISMTIIVPQTYKAFRRTSSVTDMKTFKELIVPQIWRHFKELVVPQTK